MKTFFQILFLALITTSFVGLSACTKVMVYAKDRPVDPIVQSFAASPKEVFAAAGEVLKSKGYKIGYKSETRGRLRTGWVSTSSDSHYVELFGKKDYGTVGAYYRLLVEIDGRDSQSTVSITATPRSTVPNVKSSGRIEKKILKGIAAHVRPEDIDITNVGLEEKRAP